MRNLIDTFVRKSCELGLILARKTGFQITSIQGRTGTDLSHLPASN